MFGVLAWLFMNPVSKTKAINQSMKNQYILRILFLIIAWGYVTECIQLLVPGRSYELLDWAADSSGALLAFIIATRTKK